MSQFLNYNEHAFFCDAKNKNYTNKIFLIDIMNIVRKLKKTKNKQKEIGGPKGPEPTRYGDWEKKGRCIDF